MLGFPGGAVVENLPANAGDKGSNAGDKRKKQNCIYLETTCAGI